MKNLFFIFLQHKSWQKQSNNESDKSSMMVWFIELTQLLRVIERN